MKQKLLNYLHRIVKSKWFTIFFSYVLFSYLTIVPNIYSWNMRMPEESEIQRSYGRLIYKGNNKTGYYPGIINEKGVKEFFSCRLSEGTRHLCNISKETFNTLKYKQTEIGWYHQKNLTNIIP